MKDIPDIVEEYMNEINKITGRDYKLFNYYGASRSRKYNSCYGFCM